ncbi:MAG: VOC family protein [Verrucomicrobiota bacterium]
MTVGDLDRELAFYTGVLRFELVGRRATRRGAADDFFGLPRSETRSVELRLGEEHVTLTEHLTNKGLPIGRFAEQLITGFSIAIVVRDMDAAYRHLREQGIRHVSTGPQTLPGWNQSAGGIRAFYFTPRPGRSCRNHLVSGRRKAIRSGSSLKDGMFLGIDHTAVKSVPIRGAVSVYRDRLGMRLAGAAEETHGPEQEHLNQVFGARLRITALRAPRGPGIELLEYLAPPGGRARPVTTKASDLIFWHTDVRLDRFEAFVPTNWDGLQLVSKAIACSTAQNYPTPPVLILDPDGHALRLE